MRKSLLLFVAAFVHLVVNAQTANPPALQVIQLSDLKADMYALADAHFKGRSSGTLDELKASAWLAEKYRSIGLLPAGDDGTYLQFFTIWRNHISANSSPCTLR